MNFLLAVFTLALSPGLAEVNSKPQSASEFRRTYPGSKDDSDLTVQVLRPITRKGSDIDKEDFSSVEPAPDDQEGAPPPANSNNGEFVE